MEYRLKANKSKLYKLVKKHYPEIGHMRETEFVEYPTGSYGLKFVENNTYHHAYLTICAGKARIVDDWKGWRDDGGRFGGSDARILTMEELQEYGLLEEVAP